MKAQTRNHERLRCDSFPIDEAPSTKLGKARYVPNMETAAKLLEEAMQLPEDEREELAAQLLDSIEPPPGISIEDQDEIEIRASEARDGKPGIPWDEVKRDLLK